MKVGIIGSGAVAKALAKGFLKYGKEVMVSSRSVEKQKILEEDIGNGVQAGSFDEAAVFGELLVLAVDGDGALNALELSGKENLSGKTVIDASNPISDEGPEKGVLKFFTQQNSSLMEELQAAYPDAHFVKAFNSVGSAHMVDPDFNEGKPTMFICGNNEAAKQQVSGILDRFGWEVEDMGPAEAARAIEPLCILWCIPGFRENRWSHAFKLLTK